MFKNLLFSLDIFNNSINVSHLQRLLSECKKMHTKIILLYLGNILSANEKLKELKLTDLVSDYVDADNGICLWLLHGNVRLDLSKTLFISSNRDFISLLSSANATTLFFREDDTSEIIEGADVELLGFEDLDYQFLDKTFRRHNRLPWTICTTERTVIREITVADVPKLYDIYTPAITRFVEPLFENMQDEIDYTVSYIDNMYKFYEFGMWIVEDKLTGQIIGRAGLELRDLGDSKELELGYIIGEEFQNQGIGSEVCMAIIDYARTNLEYPQISAFISEDNEISIKLIKKLDFYENGQVFDQREAKFLKRYTKKI